MVGNVSAPSCHPGLVPEAPFSPGLSGPRHKAGVTREETTGDAGVPKSASRVERSFGTPLLPVPFAGSERSRWEETGGDPEAGAPPGSGSAWQLTWFLHEIMFHT